MLQATLAFALDWRAIFSAGAVIRTPIGLLWFLIAAVLAGYAIKTRADMQKLRSLSDNDRSASLDSYVSRYGINLTGIGSRSQYDLVLHEMKLRLRRQVFATILALAAFGVCFTLVFRSTPSSPVGPLVGQEATADALVISYMDQILVLRGEFEARNPGWSGHVRQEGLRLARLIGNVEPMKLRPARKIIQREYKGWALLIVARTFGAEFSERDVNQQRIEYAAQAVGELDAGIAMMQDIEMRYRAGKGGQETQKLYDWMAGESADVERSHYLKAVAIAIIARAGGLYTKGDVHSELARISPKYLLSNPPEKNPDLDWALH